MPNTLAHLGVQGPASRIAIPGADLKWVFAGCVVPDLPWIARRVVHALPAVEVSPYDLRLYAIAQSSLLMCLILSAGLAAFSQFAGRVFAILALNALLHLLLDATETKWGNGVHLFAPFSWRIDNFGLYWPEDATALAITGLGLVFFGYAWWRLPPRPALDLAWPRGRRAAVAAVALLAYILLPPVFFPALLAADTHSVATLVAPEERPGRPVAFDRVLYVPRPDGDALIVTWAGEELAVAERPLDRSTTVSVRGRFLDETTVEIRELHAHWAGLRDLASYVGLLLVLAWWLRSLWGLVRAARSDHRRGGV